MTGIILAAGRGVRMGSFTDALPKPLLTVSGKNLIEWKLEALPAAITDIILIVGYKKEMIIEYFGNTWQGLPITYLEQIELDGTGGALALCKDHVSDRALILMGDDIYAKEDLERLLDFPFSMLVHDEGDAGYAKKGQIVEENGLLVGINEGNAQTGKASPLINTGACVISKEYFKYPPVKFTEKEYGLPHTLVSLSNDFPVHIVKASRWIQITDPESLRRAELLVRD